MDGVDGALWQEPALVGAQIDGEPNCDRIVVAIDPPVTGHSGSDECGIIVAGVKMAANPQDWTAYVLADYTVQGTSPLGWITAAIEAYHDYNADRLVAEVNQGGDLIQELLHGQDATVSYRAVRATRGKQTRAEPIAALYEQRRICRVKPVVLRCPRRKRVLRQARCCLLRMRLMLTIAWNAGNI